MRAEKHTAKKKNNAIWAIVLIIAVLAVAAETVSLYFFGNIRSVMEIEAGSPVPAAADFIKVYLITIIIIHFPTPFFF